MNKQNLLTFVALAVGISCILTLFLILLGIRFNGHVMVYENNAIILYTELTITFLSFPTLIYHLAKMTKQISKKPDKSIEERNIRVLPLGETIPHKAQIMEVKR